MEWVGLPSCPYNKEKAKQPETQWPFSDLSKTKVTGQTTPLKSGKRDKSKESPPRSAYTGLWTGSDYLNVNFDSLLETECELAWVAIDLGSKEAPYFHRFYH